MAVVSCALHCFALALFGLSWVVANFSTAKICFHNYENVNMARIVKKLNNFIFSLLVT